MKNNCQKKLIKVIIQNKIADLRPENSRRKKISTNTTDELLSLVIIDSGVQNYQELLKGVKKEIYALILLPYLDPVWQITTILAQHPEITTLHLVSHGSPGCLYLGNSQLNLSNLENYQEQLKEWKLKQILIYGCNVAATETGKDFLTKLNQLTGATIQASAFPTGNALLGGNWDLEVTVENTQSSLLSLFPELAFRSEILRDYQSILAPNLVGVWERITGISDVAVVGNYAYAVGDGLEVIDISDLTNPIFRTFTNTISGSVIRVSGNTAYVAAGDKGLQILNLSNPTQPSLLGAYDTPGVADVTIVGNIAYVADRSTGLQIIDISNPALPALLGSYDTPGEASEVAVVGNTAYVAGGIGLNPELQIIDISNPTQPVLVGTYGNFSYVRDITVVGNTAYVTDYNYGLQILDITNPTQPVFLGSYGGVRNPRDVRVVGNTAYITGYYGLSVVDISNPAQPVFLQNYGGVGSSGDLTIVGNSAYFIGSGIEILNISNPTQPELLGSYTVARADNVAVVGNTAYLAGNGEIQILNISNRAQPTLLEIYDTPGDANDLTVIGNTAYLADGSEGLQIFDISNPSQLRLLETYDTPGYAQNVTVVENRAYVADGEAGLQIFDISGITGTDQTAQSRLLGNYDPSNSVEDVTVVGNIAYITDISRVLQIVDISNPAQPALLSSYDTPGSAFDLTVIGNTAYVADGDAGLQILDISNRSQPTLLGSYDTPGSASDVTVVGLTAYVTDGDAGLQILDITNRAQPTLLATYDNTGNFFDDTFNGFGSPLDITVEGNYAYLASSGGLEIIDINNAGINPNSDQLLNYPVYRFYNPNSRGHFFTINSTERDNIVANPEWGYQYEGTGFYASTTPGENLLPVFRFYNPNSKGHFFTTNQAERDNILANPQWNYQFEGIGFYAYGADANLGNDIFRFYNATSAGHFFTPNPAERDTVLANPQWGYTFEGVGFEAA